MTENKAASSPLRVKVIFSPSGSVAEATTTPSPPNIFSLTLAIASKVINGDTFIDNSRAASLAELSSCSKVSTTKLVPVVTAVEIFDIKLFSSSTTNF